MPELTVAELAATIDHAILRPEGTRTEVDAELAVAVEWGVFSVCVRPADVAHAVVRVAGTGVAVGTVIGFPHGATTTDAKVAEARRAVADGAVELDMVVNIGALRSGFDDVVADDIRAVVDAAEGRVVKVILETSFLDAEQIARGCRLAERAGADFVKTSTGFGGGGATTADVRLMRASVGPGVRVKASGGVRGLATALEMLDAGATRLGTSASATILGELQDIRSGAAASGAADPSSY
ncbi:deoxyribose-phosphate aldolase [Microbacterium sp. X-17]|uniref:deoxyribose-phosphate aldolase n=1 Tax=Microbacterium sp. X-17 TaxID=3144404 RepID=UPI0031F50D70